MLTPDTIPQAADGLTALVQNAYRTILTASHYTPLVDPQSIMDQLGSTDVRFPTMQAWEAHVKRCTTEEQLNAAVKLLNRARKVVGIHNFLHTNQMGLAVWHLNQRAEYLGLYKVSDGTYRKSST